MAPSVLGSGRVVLCAMYRICGFWRERRKRRKKLNGLFSHDPSEQARVASIHTQLEARGKWCVIECQLDRTGLGVNLVHLLTRRILAQR